MPRKTKDQNELKDKSKVEKKVETKAKTKAVKKSAQKSKSTTTKKATTKSTAKAATTKTTSTASKKSTKTKSTNKTSTSKPKKSTTSKSTKKVEKVQAVEYYDLPYRYNQTIVKILAQTPTNLFVYWDISDNDREKYKKIHGDNFFETTKPVLIVYNDTLNYNFEVEINDFANIWYINVNDSKCEYRVELGRKPIYQNDYKENYFYISSSNEIEAPNDKILFDPNQKMIYFKNVKNNNITSKNISTLSFMKNMGKIYNIYDFYKSIYKEEDVSNIYDMLNPSSKI